MKIPLSYLIFIVWFVAMIWLTFRTIHQEKEPTHDELHSTCTVCQYKWDEERTSDKAKKEFYKKNHNKTMSNAVWYAKSVYHVTWKNKEYRITRINFDQEPILHVTVIGGDIIKCTWDDIRYSEE